MEEESLVLFLDFYKAFDTVEHNFLFDTLKVFVFGDSFINVVKMFYHNINSSVILGNNTSQRFCINRGVQQGCPFSPFLFLLVVELLSISIRTENNIAGIEIFGMQLKISQLADDTTLFLKSKKDIPKVIALLDVFSKSSGLLLIWTNAICFLYTTSQKLLFVTLLCAPQLNI